MSRQTERAINRLEQQLLELTRVYFLRHHGEFHFENLPAVLFVAFNSAVFTGVRHRSRPPPFRSRDEVIDERMAVLAGYPRPAVPAVAPRSAPAGRRKGKRPQRSAGV